MCKCEKIEKKFVFPSSIVLLYFRVLRACTTEIPRKQQRRNCKKSRISQKFIKINLLRGLEKRRIIFPEPLTASFLFTLRVTSMPDVYIRCRTTRRIMDNALLLFLPGIRSLTRKSLLSDKCCLGFCRDEKEPLREEKKITPIIDSGLRRETSITFDGKRSVSKTGFVGKDSAV